MYDFTSYLVVCADGFVGNVQAIQSGFKEAFINGASDILLGNQDAASAFAFGSSQLVENAAIVLGTPGVDPTQGDGDLRLNIIYRILNVSNMTVDIT